MKGSAISSSARYVRSTPSPTWSAVSQGRLAHVFEGVDPVRDVEVIDAELMLADLEVLGRAIEKRKRDWQTHPQDTRRKRRMMGWKDLERGIPLRQLGLDAGDSGI